MNKKTIYNQIKQTLFNIKSNNKTVLDSINEVRFIDLLYIGNKGKVIEKPVIFTEITGHQLCHQMASWYWLKDNTKEYVLGFGYCNETNSWNYHSFLLDTKEVMIYEPTNVIRDIYFGRILTKQETRILACEELDNIHELDLHVTDKMIKKLIN